MSAISVRDDKDVSELANIGVLKSDWKLLQFEDIQNFAEATGDTQWIHIDKARIEKESPFSKPIAHGFYTVSRIPRLLFEIVSIEGFSLVVNYGLNKVRFPSPLKEGDQYRLSTQVSEIVEKSDFFHLTFDCEIEVQGSDKPACVAQSLLRFYR